MTDRITPLPWKLTNGLSRMYYYIYPEGKEQGFPLAKIITQNKYIEESPKANAAYIVHCANNFPKLISAIETALAQLEIPGTSNDFYKKDDYVGGLVLGLREALEKAKGVANGKD